MEPQEVTVARSRMVARVAADAAAEKAKSAHSVGDVRRAARDAYRELDEHYGNADDVYAVALPSERL